MSLIGNILWLIFGGLFAAIGYFLGGVVLCLTIIGIPFGIKAIQFSFAVLTPFGKTVTQTPRGEGCIAMAFNIIWLLVFGWGIALIHLTFAAILAITIVGLPFAKQHAKLMMVALFPFTFKME